MSAVEKILRKVEQDRSRGHDERALNRLKEALSEQPQEFLLVREAAALCFELGRIVEAATILRGALRRCPDARPDILELAQNEFQRSKPPELAEFLFDLYLADAALDRARDVVRALEPADLETLLLKLRGKESSFQEDILDGRADARVCGILLAQALVLAAQEQWSEMARVCESILDLDHKQTETVGHLARLELRDARESPALRLVLGRCYLNVNDLERAAEQFAGTAVDANSRTRALHALEKAPNHPVLMEVRARLLLLEKQYDAAHATLLDLFETNPQAAASVRKLLESTAGAAEAAAPLRQLYARTLVATNAVQQAVQEIDASRGRNGDVEANWAIVEEILSQRPGDADALLLRARLAMDSGRHAEAAEAFRRCMQTSPVRRSELRPEIEKAAEQFPRSPELGCLMVHLLADLELPHEATEALHRVRQAGQVPASHLYERALDLASRYGLSAELLVLLVESALDTEHESEAQAAVHHYHASPGTRVRDFTRRLEELLQNRPTLADPLTRVLSDLPLPVSLRLALLRCSLEHGEPKAALEELGLLVVEEPGVREKVLALLAAFLQRHDDMAHALELAAELHLDAGDPVASAQLLARALRAEPDGTDRICRRADRLFNAAAEQEGVWRPIVAALVEIDRPRHARDICYRAAQTVPFDRQGFLHIALGNIHLQERQASAAANAFESSLLCGDAALDEVIQGLRDVLALDTQNGHAHSVLARALLRTREHDLEAVQLLADAVRLDPMLVEHVLDTLQEHAEDLADLGVAAALSGTLWLRRGEHARGVAALGQALNLEPELGPQILPALQVEWDRDPETVDTGLILSRALVASQQERRACRLLAELGRRFPQRHDTILKELETLLQTAILPEAHRIVWDILIARGEGVSALARARQAIEAGGITEDLRCELLEAALQRFPQVSWVVCRLASLEIRNGNAVRAETLLHELLQRDSEAQSAVLEVLEAARPAPSENLNLLEIDTLVAIDRWKEALHATRRLREEFPAATDAALERLRLLATRGDATVEAATELALLLKDRGDLQEAIEILEHNLESRRATDATRPHEMQLLLASLYVDLGRVHEGKELLASVLEAGGGDPETLQFMERLSSEGLSRKIEELRETIEGTPGNLRARLELARLSLLARDFNGTREALRFPADGPAIEAARRFLLARSYAEADQPHLAAAVTGSIELAEVPETELRRNILQLRARCTEQLGRFGEAHVLYLRLLSEFPESKLAQERVRTTYQMHLETSLSPQALVLEKRTNLDPP